jgi:hypothetical protein
MINKESKDRSVKFSAMKYIKRTEKLRMDYYLWVTIVAMVGEIVIFRRRFSFLTNQVSSTKYLLYGNKKKN